MNPRAPGNAADRAEMLIAKLEVLRAEAVTESFLPMVYFLDEALQQLRRQVEHKRGRAPESAPEGKI